MTVALRDEIGFVAIKIVEEDGVSFYGECAYFTSENGTDFKVNVESIISISAE